MAGFDRRQVIGRAAALGTAVWATPKIASVSAAVGTTGSPPAPECACPGDYSVEDVCWQTAQPELVELSVHGITLGTCAPTCPGPPSIYYSLLVTPTGFLGSWSFSGHVDGSGLIRILDQGDRFETDGTYRLSLFGDCGEFRSCTGPLFEAAGTYHLADSGGFFTGLDGCD